MGYCYYSVVLVWLDRAVSLSLDQQSTKAKPKPGTCGFAYVSELICWPTCRNLFREFDWPTNFFTPSNRPSAPGGGMGMGILFPISSRLRGALCAPLATGRENPDTTGCSQGGVGPQLPGPRRWWETMGHLSRDRRYLGAPRCRCKSHVSSFVVPKCTRFDFLILLVLVRL